LQTHSLNVFSTGHLVWPALEPGKILREKGINPEVINIHTIKPRDVEGVIRSVRKR
jgi:transketolase